MIGHDLLFRLAMVKTNEARGRWHDGPSCAGVDARHIPVRAFVDTGSERRF